MIDYFNRTSLPFADGFSYNNGWLVCGSEPVQDLIRAYPTPFYLYNIDAIVEKYRQYAQVLSILRHRTSYAVKANSNLTLLRKLSVAGCSMDVNSAGELFRAVRAGIEPRNITMTGVGKTENDIRYALEQGILFINSESRQECLRIDHVAATMGVTANIVLRINPDVDAATHPYIATGLAEHKFGLGLEEARETLHLFRELTHTTLSGFGMHLGSQLFEISPYEEGLDKLAGFAAYARDEFGFGIQYLNIGGGMGVSYDDTEREFPLTDLAAAMSELLQKYELNVEVVSEPGRYLVANGGVIIATVEYVKQNAGKTFVIVDAGMNDLIRPALYDAEHKVLPVHISEGSPVTSVDVVGPVCESGDTFLTDYPLPNVEEGDRVAIFSSGAYGAVMSSRYNSRPRAAEIGLVDGAPQVIRRAESLNDMIEHEL